MFNKMQADQIDREAYERLNRDHPTLVHLVQLHLKLGESPRQIADAADQADPGFTTELYSMVFCAASHMRDQEA